MKMKYILQYNDMWGLAQQMYFEKETGEPQQSKDWGYGDRKRVVTIGAYDASTDLYTVYLLCWGFPEKTITGKWTSVFIEAADVLANAG